MKYALFPLIILLTLTACDRAPKDVDPTQMSLSNPGRTPDNQWVIGANTLTTETAEADARLQTARKNCRLIALPAEPLFVAGGDTGNGRYIMVGDAPADVAAPEIVTYAERYNAVVRAACGL